MWADPPEYYDPPGGLLYSPMRIPEQLLHPLGDGLPLFREQKQFLNTSANHAAHPALQASFALANYQMRHIRDGVAAAWALGRKLVLPPLACAYDRGPFPHPGKSGGAFEQLLPIYPCPLDYVFDLERKSPAGAKAGGAPMLLEVAREYSLLNSTRMPRATLDSALRLAQVPAGESAQSLTERYGSSRLVELATLPPSFGEGSLLTHAQQLAFKEALMYYTDVWCCINPVKCARARRASAHPAAIARAFTRTPRRATHARVSRGAARPHHVRYALGRHPPHRPNAPRVDVPVAHRRGLAKAALLTASSI